MTDNGASELEKMSDKIPIIFKSKTGKPEN
jgi:hypothetical protein